MRKIFFILILIILAVAAYFFFYNPIKEPEFISLKIIEINKVDKTNFQIKADANFNNPNAIGATLLNTELDVYNNDIKIAHISQTEMKEIKANSPFVLPIIFSIDILKSGYAQSVSGILESVLKKELVIPAKFKGYCQIKILNTSQKIPVEFTDEIKIN